MALLAIAADRGAAQVAQVAAVSPVLQRVAGAMTGLDYELVQIRRVRDAYQGLGGGGAWVGTIERAVHRAASQSAGEAFSLQLAGFEGRSMGRTELDQRAELFQRQAGFLFRHHGFRVDSVIRADANYRVRSLGESFRAHRLCARFAVVARLADRPSWIVDLDLATGYPLYSGEFSVGGQLVAELEVIDARFASLARIPVGNAWAWTAVDAVEDFASVQGALARMQFGDLLVPQVAEIGQGYQLASSEVMIDPLNGERRLVLCFSDGLDAVFVQQRQVPPAGTQGGHSLYVYSDAGITQCRFQHRQTEFLLAGRHIGMRNAAVTLFRRAVATF